MNADDIKSLYSNKKVLAPLVGGSDLSFRLLCRKYGAELTFTEMCIADYWLEKQRGTNKKLKDYTFEFDKLDRPLILQVAGSDAKPIIEMVNHPLFEGNIDGVDLNCGCPQSFAQEKGIGCYALNNPEKLVLLVKEIIENISYPLSVKLRLHNDIQTTIEIIGKLKNVGVNIFTVHGRYHWQRNQNRGLCDWDAIKQIREAFPDIILIGNGDVKTFEDFEKFKTMSNVDSVMVGYGALLDPTLFTKDDISLQDVLNDYIKIAYTKKNKFIRVLKHIEWILRRKYSNVIFKSELFCCDSIESMASLLLTLDPPIHIDLDSLKSLTCNIEFPPRIEDMNPKQLKKLKKRKLKIEKKRSKKIKHSNHYDDMVDECG